MKIFCSNIGLHRSLFLSLSFFPPQTLNKPKYSIVTVQSFKAVHQRMGLKKLQDILTSPHTVKLLSEPYYGPTSCAMLLSIPRQKGHSNALFKT